MNNVYVILTIVLSVVAPCCYAEAPIVNLKDAPKIAAELELFATSLDESTLSNETALSDAIVNYLKDHGPEYFGSTVAVLSPTNGTAVYSPYAYWNDNNTALIRSDGLMDPSYKIDEQAWLREPIDQKKAVWTDPYFDAGGGNVWMMTRSYPIISQGGDVIAVATTDVHVPDPSSGVDGGMVSNGGDATGAMFLLLGMSLVPMFLV
jgi:hypothetical protein